MFAISCLVLSIWKFRESILVWYVVKVLFNFGFNKLILSCASSYERFSAFISNKPTEYPFDLHDCASNRAQVGGSIAEYFVERL